MFQTSAPINSLCLHPNQGKLILGDQSGFIHLWDLQTDHNEQFVSVEYYKIQTFHFILIIMFRYPILKHPYNMWLLILMQIGLLL